MCYFRLIRRCVIKTTIIFICLILSVSSLTYYVDYQDGKDSNPGISKDLPWKNCPGMKNFEGTYSHKPGDWIVFKGGVTWPGNCFPMTIRNSGAINKVDTYTSDKSWYY